MGSKIQHGGHCKEQKGNPPQKGIVEQRRIIIGLVNDLEQRLALCRHLGSSTGIQWYNGISARQLQHWIDSILQPAMVLDTYESSSATSDNGDTIGLFRFVSL